ncbi:MAG: hypothetical protein LBK01_06930, partial [Burkholderiaceae bacterium]|nr:hypothetical protein [Burkholderiaceae bacterium]
MKKVLLACILALLSAKTFSAASVAEVQPLMDKWDEVYIECDSESGKSDDKGYTVIDRPLDDNRRLDNEEVLILCAKLKKPTVDLNSKGWCLVALPNPNADTKGSYGSHGNQYGWRICKSEGVPDAVDQLINAFYSTEIEAFYSQDVPPQYAAKAKERLSKTDRIIKQLNEAGWCYEGPQNNPLWHQYYWQKCTQKQRPFSEIVKYNTPPIPASTAQDDEVDLLLLRWGKYYSHRSFNTNDLFWKKF